MPSPAPPKDPNPAPRWRDVRCQLRRSLIEFMAAEPGLIGRVFLALGVRFAAGLMVLGLVAGFCAFGVELNVPLIGGGAGGAVALSTSVWRFASQSSKTNDEERPHE